MPGDPKPAAKRKRDFYQQWRAQAKRWAKTRKVPGRLLDVGLAAPDLLHLLTRLLADPRVPAADKAKVAVAAAYLASPIDLLPELLFGPVGVMDDVAVVAWALRGLLGPEHRDIILEHWAGEEDVVELLTGVLDSLSGVFSSARLEGIRKAFATAARALNPASREPATAKTEGAGGEGEFH